MQCVTHFKGQKRGKQYLRITRGNRTLCNNILKEINSVSSDVMFTFNNSYSILYNRVSQFKVLSESLESDYFRNI